MRSKTHHFEETQIIPEGGQDPNEGHDEHDHAEDHENYGWSQEDPWKSLILLPLHFRIDADAQDETTNQLP